MSSIQRITTTAPLANANVVARAAAAGSISAFGSAHGDCWLPVMTETKPVTMGYHRSRRLRPPSP